MKRIKRDLQENNTAAAANTLMGMPSDVRLNIMQYLNIMEISRMSQVNRNLNQWTETQPALWVMIFNRNYGKDNIQFDDFLKSVYAFLPEKNVDWKAKGYKMLVLAYATVAATSRVGNFRFYERTKRSVDMINKDFPDIKIIWNIQSIRFESAENTSCKDIDELKDVCAEAENELENDWPRRNDIFQWPRSNPLKKVYVMLYYAFRLIQIGYFPIFKQNTRSVIQRCISCDSKEAHLQEEENSKHIFCSQLCQSNFYFDDNQ